MLILCSCLHLNRKTKSPRRERKNKPKKNLQKNNKNQWKIYNYTKKTIRNFYSCVFGGISANYLWFSSWSNLTLFTRSPSQSVYLSVFPFVWQFLNDVIAVFARALNEFVELLKNQIIQISYYTNPFAATDSITIAKMYLVLEEGAKINTISIS